MRLSLLFSLLFLSFGPGGFAASPLVVYSFEENRKAGQDAAEPSRAQATHGVQGSRIQWMLPQGERATNGFGGKLSTAYLNASGASRQFDPDRYLTFTLRAEGGQRLDLQSLVLETGASTTSTYDGAAFEVKVQVSADVSRVPFNDALYFLPDRQPEASVEIAPVPTLEGVFQPLEVDLSGTVFQGREAITFRVYLYSSARSSAAFLRLREIRVNGTVAKPR